MRLNFHKSGVSTDSTILACETIITQRIIIVNAHCGNLTHLRRFMRTLHSNRLLNEHKVRILGIEPRPTRYKQAALPLSYTRIKVALKQLIRPICGLDSTSLFVIRVYSYEIVICRHHHCCLPVFVDDTKMFSIFDSFHKFVETFLKFFHAKNFHSSKRVTICKAIFTYCFANYF